MYTLLKNLTSFTTLNFVDCLDLIAEVYVSQYWCPRLKPMVVEFIERIADKVLKDIDEHRFSPLFNELFIRYHIPYSGKGVVRGSKIRVSKPGSFPPFLTRAEFKKKFGVEPKEYSDEELTRKYDSVGNVIGHFTVPNLRELLSPLDPDIEAEIKKEEFPTRAKHRQLQKFLLSEECKRSLFELRKQSLLQDYKSGSEIKSELLKSALLCKNNPNDAGLNAVNSTSLEAVTTTETISKHSLKSEDDKSLAEALVEM